MGPDHKVANGQGLIFSDTPQGGLQDLARTRARDVALVDAGGGTRLSFDDLACLSLQMHRDLTGAGVAEGALLAYASDAPFLSAMMFLTIGTRASVAPLATGLTADEARAALDQLRPAAVVVSAQDHALVSAAAACGLPVFLFGLDGARGVSLDPLPADALTSPAGRLLAPGTLVLTTSGTTGRPKMVALDGARLLDGAARVAKILELGPQDTGVEIMPLHHIHGIKAGLLTPLLHGGGTAILPSRDPAALLAVAADIGATWYSAVPTIHHGVLRAAAARPDRAAACRFRVIRSSSSALPASVRAGLREAFGCPVVEAYAMTEATHQIVSQAPGVPDSHGNAGRPEPGTCAILDPSGAEVPVGEAGEIWVTGGALIDAYLDNPEATAEAFRGGWMRTGDIGLIDPEGRLVLVGRSKEMVKRGGAQVAPTEVEDALLSLPGVVEAIAFGVAHPTLGQDLVAAVVMAHDSATDPRLLRGSLIGRLSDYKVPSRVIVLDDIPKGPTGKPMRLAMESMLADRLSAGSGPPASPTEALLATLFAETLGLPKIGREDDFFLSGGDSLSGTGMMADLNALIATELAPEILFHYPTPAELAAHVETIDGGRVKRLIEMLDREGGA